METKITEQIYHQIAVTLVKILPEEWDRVILYAEYRGDYKKVFFYYFTQSKENPVYSLDIPDLFDISEDDYDEFENQLYSCFTKLWEEFKIQEQEQWTNLTFTLFSNGKMKIDYDYEDISYLSPIEKQEEWEAKHLA
ncbi:immunity protein YezG family protein [Virgibacillus halodenitrificans]|uniref:immunity protein YezG family protein n=1 Tax=Virgibacillus halodenitrificans TaxID=1482 RepID=UPI002DBF46EA|nr:immunity protein YezG family protein [Virgibacillus halodenitrificans]MEC2159693.1 DUF600 family protein [Virgibacillus halodenitrificans]